jgi:hypothetical protein
MHHCRTKCLIVYSGPKDQDALIQTGYFTCISNRLYEFLKFIIGFLSVLLKVWDLYFYAHGYTIFMYRDCCYWHCRRILRRLDRAVCLNLIQRSGILKLHNFNRLRNNSFIKLISLHVSTPLSHLQVSTIIFNYHPY